MSLADFMQELQTQDNIIYSQPPESAIHVIPPEKVCTNIIPPKDLGQKPPTTIKLKIKQKNVTTDAPKAESSIIVEPPAQPSTVIDLSKANNSIIKKPPSQTNQRPPQQPITRQVASNNQPINRAPNGQPISRPPNGQPNMQPNNRPPNTQPVNGPPNNQPINRPNTQIAPNLSTGPNVPTRPVGPPNVPTRPVGPVKPAEAIPQKVQPANLTDDELFFKSGTESSKYDIWIGYFNRAKTSKKSNPIVDRMRLGRFTITPDNKVLLLPDYDIVGKDPDDVLKDKWF